MNINGKWMSETEVQAYIDKLTKLLKSCIHDFEVVTRYCGGFNCDHCPHIRVSPNCIWQHAGEARKLIGGNENDTL